MICFLKINFDLGIFEKIMDRTLIAFQVSSTTSSTELCWICGSANDYRLFIISISLRLRRYFMTVTDYCQWIYDKRRKFFKRPFFVSRLCISREVSLIFSSAEVSSSFPTFRNSESTNEAILFKTSAGCHISFSFSSRAMRTRSSANWTFVFSSWSRSFELFY